MRVLLLIPPMTQLNTPYPSTAYLKGFLRKHGYDVVQADPAIELVYRVFSQTGLQEIARELQSHLTGESEGGKQKRRLKKQEPHPTISNFLNNLNQYIHTVEPVLRFLQGKDPSLALRIVSREFLPEGPRFTAIMEGSSGSDSDPLSWAFGGLGIQDRAKYLASLYIDDLADVIRIGIDPLFGLSRYGEKLAASVPVFDELEKALKEPASLPARTLAEITKGLLALYQPDLVGISVPFPGNVYGAFRIAQTVKQLAPNTAIVLGGGYVNTELRQISEPKVFDYFDYITLDDGEKPLLCILEHLKGKRTREELLRTFIRENGNVVLKTNSTIHDIPHKDTGTPSYEGLPLDRYLSILEMLNPMHRIWSDGRWNKLTLAHGCYWKKCHFCDISLDYIGRYDPASADLIIDRIEEIIRQTGQSGFHFVDEAAPPAVLRGLATRLIERQVTITWWGNIRFEKTFSPELTGLLAKSGCIAVSGGLEVASDRLLKLMNKGVTVEQVARVTHAFTQAGIMVHAYLMYGFPTQTVQETIDALERVRQLFQAGCIQSAFWHQFAATIHSPIGKNPEKFGIRLIPPPKVTFALNDLPFEDPTGCDHELLGEGLRKALYNYMHGVGFDLDVRSWFSVKVPRAQVPPDLIAAALTDMSAPRRERHHSAAER